MPPFRSPLALFALIILEGYVVLSSELLAIRLTVPFVGSGTDTVSVIIAAVLMPLAFGYHAGGRFQVGKHFVPFIGKVYMSVRDKLVYNMMVALVFLLFGLSYTFLSFFFGGLIELGITNRVALTTIYSLIFLATPVYLLGQTIPLACNFFSKEKLVKVTGKILFVSTIGSFLGAVFSTLVLMAHIGVNNTAILNFVILGGLIMMMSRTIYTIRTPLLLALVAAGAMSNSTDALRKLYIVENNQYNTIAVVNVNGERNLMLNGNGSSKYSDEGRKHDYIEFIEFQSLDPVWDAEEPKDFLIIGAGAFTLGAEDDFHNYDYVDIDASLKDIAEEHILKRRLGDNVTFHAVPARAYLKSTEKKYDVIVIDAYSGGLSLPEHLATQEFFQQIKDALKPDGKMLANIITSANFQSALSRNIDNTIRSVFPHVSRHVTGLEYDLWQQDESTIRNVIYMYTQYDSSDAKSKSIYTDLKNRSFLDRPAESKDKPASQE